MNELTLTPESIQALADNPEAVAKWCTALRGGKWVQHREDMCVADIPNSACCLHVLEMEVGGMEWDEGLNKGIPSDITNTPVSFNGIDAEDIKAVLSDPEFSIGTFVPSEWNDDLLLTFDQIATLLETGSVEWDDE